MDDVGVFGVEDVGRRGEVFVVVGGIFGVGVVVVVASSREDVFGDELRDEFAELAHVEGNTAHAHAHVTSAATASTSSTASGPAGPAATVVVVGATVMVRAVVVRGTASARATEGEAGAEGVFMWWRAGEVGLGGLRSLSGRWGRSLEGIVIGAFWWWGTGFFVGFWVVGGRERMGGGCGIEGGDPVPEGVGGLIEEADIRHCGCCLV